MFRFKWIDENTIKIINEEGIEKKLDIRDNMKEIQFNFIPLYKERQKDPITDGSGNFYTNRPPLAVTEVLSRLKRKY